MDSWTDCQERECKHVLFEVEQSLVLGGRAREKRLERIPVHCCMMRKEGPDWD